MRLEYLYRGKFIFMLDKPFKKIDDFTFVLNNEIEKLNNIKKFFQKNNLKLEVQHQHEDDYISFEVEVTDKNIINRLKKMGFNNYEEICVCCGENEKCICCGENTKSEEVKQHNKITH